MSRFDIVNSHSFETIFNPFFPILQNELDYFTPPITRRVGFGSELITLFDRLEMNKYSDRKYTWTAEIKSHDEERKYKWTAEIKDGKKKSSQLTAEIKSKGSVERKYTFKASTDDIETELKEKKKCQKWKGKNRVIEIDDPSDHGAIVLRQVFAKRRGKQQELSQQDAAALIQLTYRSYQIRRSQVLRALRELAIGKNKLKEIRTLFNNFTYRRRLTRDAEESQRFSEKIIVLLLTVDAIQGDDLMVRAAKNSMVDELEAMLDVVEPQHCGKSLYMRGRRTFDMPDSVMNKVLAEGVAQVVKMLDEEVVDSETFEVCL